MILLADNCLLFETDSGESIPYTAENISVEVLGDAAKLFDAEFIKHAAAAVFHYYREELGRDSVSVAEFSLSLEKVLRGFKLVPRAVPESSGPRIVQSDLCALAPASEAGCELFFFPRLRDELQNLLRQSPNLLCFQGLRPCVKHLAGAQRWTRRCQDLHDEIVEYLRSWISREHSGTSCAVVVK